MSYHAGPTTALDPARADLALTALLVIQGITLFVAIPLGPSHPLARFLLDACHVAFAMVCIAMMTRHRAVQAGLLVLVVAISAGPVAGDLADTVAGRFGMGRDAGHELVALLAFAFNLAVTILVARQVFSSGRVTARRVEGAVLLFLNVAALFAVAFSELVLVLPGSIALAGGAPLPTGAGMRTAQLTYFSLTTITTTGFGDVVPVHPLARSLATLEAVVGQLFPATLLARLVALQLAHAER